MYITIPEHISIAAATNTDTAPLRCNQVICHRRSGLHLVKTVATHYNHTVSSTLSNHLTCHIKHCPVMEIKPCAGSQGQCGTLCHIKSVKNQMRHICSQRCITLYTLASQPYGILSVCSQPHKLHIAAFHYKTHGIKCMKQLRHALFRDID